ncbi:AraC family transcriptional regulator [Paenibacillus chartarius]|uniref:AraC family transcriptional regulator n=1 Tax=Paenibacillus chartarius TaxID=747481 RepID=A0ABV6DSD7_9BACL
MGRSTMLVNVFSVLTEADKQLPLYVTSVGGWAHQEPMWREHGFPDFQWIQTVSGQGVLKAADGRRLTVSKGQGMLLYPHEEHEYAAVKEPWEVVWISWNGRQAAEMLETLGLLRTEALHISSPERTLLRCREALAGAQSADPLRSLRVSAVLYELVLDLSAYGSASELRSKGQHAEQLAPVLSLMEERSAEPLTLDMLADTLGVSPQHTCHLFQQTLGMRPFEYLKRVRLRKAKELLLQDWKLEVQQVAERVGYGNASYFIKLFKEQEGMTPAQFRGSYRM